MIGGFAVILIGLTLASVRGSPNPYLLVSLVAARLPRIGEASRRLGRGFAAGLRPLSNWHAPLGCWAFISRVGVPVLRLLLGYAALPMPASFPVRLLPAALRSLQRCYRRPLGLLEHSTR